MATDVREATSAFELLHEAQRKAGFPLSAMVELTRRCNLRCTHCYLDLDGNSGLSADQLHRVFEELAAAGTLFLTLTGGEIFMREDWLELARDARGLGFVLRLKTNGTLVTEEIAEKIAELAVMAVDVSLQGGAAAVHDAVSGRAGAFDRTVAGVRFLRRAGVRVSLRASVLETNAAALEPLIDLSRELDADLEVDPRISQSFDARRDTREIAPSGATVEQVIGLLQPEIMPAPKPRPEMKGVDNPWPCLSLQTGLLIRADGEMWRCPILPKSFGSIHDGPIKEVWERSRARARMIELSHEAPRECLECEAAWACQRCPAHAWQEHGTLARPATADCRLAAARAKGVLAASGARCDTCQALPDVPSAKAGCQQRHAR